MWPFRCCLALTICVSVFHSASTDDGEQEYVSVKTEIGTLRGYRIKSLEGKPVNVFIGVPFAKPPVGELRFKRPEALNPVDEYVKIDALTKKPMCPQIPMKLPGFELENKFNDDDCLYMNVFAPAVKEKSKTPVMVFFYGGFFQWGDNNLGLYDGVEFAAETDSVIVFPAYRVSMFGFLNSSDSAAPGNQGLFDQLMALKFIQSNVAAFGGDPDLVTIAGQSAGAISSSVHTSSPLSKGLFRRAILLSGTANTLAFFKEENGQSILFTMANFMDCFNSSSTVTEQYNSMTVCLASKDRVALLDQLSKLGGGDILGFGPGRDDAIIAGDIRRPTTLDYNVEDIMVGTTATDGELLLHQVIGLEPAFEDIARNSGPDIALRLALKMMFSVSTVGAAEIYSAYITDQENSQGYDVVIKKAPRLITDVAFDCPAKFYMNSVEKVNGNKTNIYRFSFNGPRSKALAKLLGEGPATHADDIFFFLGVALNKELNRPWEPTTADLLDDSLKGYTDEDRKFAKDLLRSIKEFMLTGKPNVPGKVDEPWPLYSEHSPSVVNLAPGAVSKSNGSISNLCHLWAPYILEGDINDVYAAPTTTTTTAKPIYRTAKVLNKSGRKFSKSRQSNHFSNAAPSAMSSDFAKTAAVLLAMSSLALLAKNAALLR